VSQKKENISIENLVYAVLAVDDSDLGLANLANFKEIIDKELSAGVKNIALDLNGLAAVNSSGLGVLIGIQNKVKSGGGSLKMINVNKRTLNIFKITQLNSFFDIAG